MRSRALQQIMHAHAHTRTHTVPNETRRTHKHTHRHRQIHIHRHGQHRHRHTHTHTQTHTHTHMHTCEQHFVGRRLGGNSQKSAIQCIHYAEKPQRALLRMCAFSTTSPAALDAASSEPPGPTLISIPMRSATPDVGRNCMGRRQVATLWAAADRERVRVGVLRCDGVGKGKAVRGARCEVGEGEQRGRGLARGGERGGGRQGGCARKKRAWRF